MAPHYATAPNSTTISNVNERLALCDLGLALPRAQKWAVLVCGTARTVPSVPVVSSPVTHLPNAKADGILKAFAGAEAEGNLYLPVFNNVPGGVELQEGGVAEGAQCVLVQTIRVDEKEEEEEEEEEGGGEKVERDTDGEEPYGEGGNELELDSLCVVVGVGRAKALTVGDIAWVESVSRKLIKQTKTSHRL